MDASSTEENDPNLALDERVLRKERGHLDEVAVVGGFRAPEVIIKEAPSPRRELETSFATEGAKDTADVNFLGEKVQFGQQVCELDVHSCWKEHSCEAHGHHFSGW